MKVLEPGHIYELDNLKSSRTTRFQFFMDPEIHDGKFLDGPSCQEVIRMLIDRVKYLESEKDWAGNQEIITHLRAALALFESRALLQKINKVGFEIENLATGSDGHLRIAHK